MEIPLVNKHRNWKKVALYVSGCALIICVGVFVLLYLRSLALENLSLAPEPGQDSGQDVEVSHFEKVVEAWNKEMVGREGVIPADPLQVLRTLGRLSDAEAQQYVFDRNIPPRVNPSLGQNTKWLVFSFVRRDLGRQWNCYADGTWDTEAISEENRSANPSPAARLIAAGYPIQEWKESSDRADWLARNRSNLVWFHPWGMFVVAGVPTTREAATTTPPDRPPGQSP